MLKGRAVEQIGEESTELTPGDCVFIPRGVIHSHTVIEAPVETICIYAGAGSIEKTGYVLDD